MNKRILKPFGIFSCDEVHGHLNGVPCMIISICLHSETKKKYVAYKKGKRKEIYLQDYDSFVKASDNALRLAVINFKNDYVDDDFLESNYRHFKGKWYRLIILASDVDNEERYCIYKPLYGDLTLTYCRPYDMFVSEVDHHKYPNVKSLYRFTSIGEIADEVGDEAAVELFKKEANI